MVSSGPSAGEISRPSGMSCAPEAGAGDSGKGAKAARAAVGRRAAAAAAEERKSRRRIGFSEVGWTRPLLHLAGGMSNERLWVIDLWRHPPPYSLATCL